MHLTPFSRIKWEQAKELRKKGFLKEAEKELKAALEEQPAHPLLMVSLATIYLQQKEFVEAKALAEEALSQNPSDPKAHYVLGEFFFQKKRYKDALSCFQKAAAKDPRPYLKVRQARTLNQMGRNKDALTVLENALVRDANNHRLLKEKALILNRMGLHDQALELYERLKEILPGDQFVKKEVMRLKGLRRAPDKTIKELEIALTMSSERDNAQLQGLLAQQLKKKNRFEEAAKRYEKAWEMEPENPFFLKQAGFCYYNLKRYDQAIKALGQALQMDPEDFVVKKTLEKIYSTTGNLNDFISLLEGILHEHPDQVSLFGKINKLRKQVQSHESDDT